MLAWVILLQASGSCQVSRLLEFMIVRQRWLVGWWHFVQHVRGVVVDGTSWHHRPVLRVLSVVYSCSVLVV